LTNVNKIVIIRSMPKNDKKIVTKQRKQINERRVKSLLAERGWTQDDLARAVDMQGSYLNRIIRNQRYADRHIDKIAHALGVSPRRIVESGPSLHEGGDSTSAFASSAE
jgi:transcriptional regulator with XRE-family HTH domain